MTPKVEDGFIEYSDSERRLMKEFGLCVTCDLENTCQIRQNNLGVMLSWNGSGEKLSLIVRICSKHQVFGHKTLTIRGE